KKSALENTNFAIQLYHQPFVSPSLIRINREFNKAKPHFPLAESYMLGTRTIPCKNSFCSSAPLSSLYHFWITSLISSNALPSSFIWKNKSCKASGRGPHTNTSLPSASRTISLGIDFPPLVRY